jgi:Flp pilus assembly protein protease CpaA
MLLLINYLVITLGLIIGTFTDFKSREVPDWLNFSLIGAGIGLGVLNALFLWSYTPLLYSIIGLTCGIIIGYIMFYAGQWGGGDAKLIMGLGALFGINIATGFTLQTLSPFFIFLINTVIIGALYGIVWALVIGLKHFHQLKTACKEKLREPHIIRLRIIVISTSVLLIILALISKNVVITLGFALLATLTFFTFYLWIITKAVEHSCMIKTLPVNKLTEGDWIYEDVWVKSTYKYFKNHLLAEQKKEEALLLAYDDFLLFYKKLGIQSLVVKRTLSLQKKAEKQMHRDFAKALRELCTITGKTKTEIAKLLIANKTTFTKGATKEMLSYLSKKYYYMPEHIYITGTKDLGISKEQITLLKELQVTTVRVKEGIPFVPSFFIAYLVTMGIGNWLLYII